MTIRHFEVQTRTVADGWINTWHENDKPLVFATELAARQAMGEFFQDLPDEMAKSYSVIDYRVRAVHFDENENLLSDSEAELLQMILMTYCEDCDSDPETGREVDALWNKLRGAKQ